MQIDYFVGIDGISITLLVMTSLVLVIATLACWEIKSNLKGFFLLFLLLDMAVIGVFCALDFFLFYMFYELMLLPLYFLIGMWGGARREYASIKFFLYTLFGSVFMLLVMVGLYLSVTDPATGNHTFNMVQMMNPANFQSRFGIFVVSHQTILGMPARTVGFVVLFIAFAIKVPVVPLHTWLPDAHVEAPTPVSIVLAGILLKNWRLRHYPYLYRHLSRSSHSACLLARPAWCYLYFIRRVQRPCPARPETDDRLFFGIAYGFCVAGYRFANCRGRKWRSNANGEPRVFINHAVFPGRGYLQPGARQGYLPFPWPGYPDAKIYGLCHDRVFRLAGLAGLFGICGRGVYISRCI
jgi:hypothetical protein